MMSLTAPFSEVSASKELRASIAACENLAGARTENFHVLTKLLPRRLRADFAVLYAFCRAADDAADERSDSETAIRELEALRTILDVVEQENVVGSGGGGRDGGDFSGFPFAPYVCAWIDLMQRCNLPRRYFDDLLDAFVQDQEQNRYATMAELLGYCARSANPVGRLVLCLLLTPGEREDEDKCAEMFRLSDATCTALQLTNFWQDVADDLSARERIYIPQSWWSEFDLIEDDIREQVAAGKSDPRFCRMIEQLVGETEVRFAEGRELWPMLGAEMRPVVQLFTLGGEGILKRIRQQHYDVLDRRPTLSKWRRLVLYLQAVVWRWRG